MDSQVFDGLTAALQVQRAEGGRLVNRGLRMVIAAPVLLALSVPISDSLGSFVPLAAATLYMLVGTPVGLVAALAGGVRQRCASREIRELEMARLPPARLLR